MRRLTPFLERRRRDFVLGGAVRDAGGLAGAGFGDAGTGHVSEGLAGAAVEAAGFGDTAGNNLFQKRRRAAARR